MSNAIKWTPGPLPEPRNGTYLVCYDKGESVNTILTSQYLGNDVTVVAHALINYPLTLNEAVTYDDSTDSWACWDINGVAFHTGLTSREEAEAAYRDEYAGIGEMATPTLPATEEEAIRLINELRPKTSKFGEAVLIDTSAALHLCPLRTEEDYADEINWRLALLDLLGGER